MPGAAASTGPGITNPQMGVGGFPPPVGGENQQQKWKGERNPELVGLHKGLYYTHLYWDYIKPR